MPAYTPLEQEEDRLVNAAGLVVEYLHDYLETGLKTTWVETDVFQIVENVLRESIGEKYDEEQILLFARTIVHSI